MKRIFELTAHFSFGITTQVVLHFSELSEPAGTVINTLCTFSQNTKRLYAWGFEVANTVNCHWIRNENMYGFSETLLLGIQWQFLRHSIAYPCPPDAVTYVPKMRSCQLTPKWTQIRVIWIGMTLHHCYTDSESKVSSMLDGLQRPYEILEPSLSRFSRDKSDPAFGGLGRGV